MTIGKDDIQYTDATPSSKIRGSIIVKVGRKRIGLIRHTALGWGYFPEGKKTADAYYPTVPEVKLSIDAP